MTPRYLQALPGILRRLDQAISDDSSFSTAEFRAAIRRSFRNPKEIDELLHEALSTLRRTLGSRLPISVVEFILPQSDLNYLQNRCVPQRDEAAAAFSAPEGYVVDDQLAIRHRRALEYQRCNEGMSYLDAVKALDRLESPM